MQDKPIIYIVKEGLEDQEDIEIAMLYRKLCNDFKIKFIKSNESIPCNIPIYLLISRNPLFLLKYPNIQRILFNYDDSYIPLEILSNSGIYIANNKQQIIEMINFDNFLKENMIIIG